jgi:hypothetical protein
MPDHNVTIRKIPNLRIGNSDMVFDINLGNELLGSLRVSRGHLVWRPANNEYGYWFNWSDFGRLATENGRRRRVNY